MEKGPSIWSCVLALGLWFANWSPRRDTLSKIFISIGIALISNWISWKENVRRGLSLMVAWIGEGIMI